MAEPELERFAEHLERLEEQHAAFDALVRDAAARRRQGLWAGLAGLLLVPVAASFLWIDGRWGVPAARRKLVFLGLLAATVVAAIVVGLALRAAVRTYRRRVPRPPTRMPALRMGHAQCSGCGAGVPIVTHEPMKCPFCTSDLVPDAATTAAIEHASEALVQAEFAKVRALMSSR